MNLSVFPLSKSSRKKLSSFVAFVSLNIIQKKLPVDILNIRFKKNHRKWFLNAFLLYPISCIRTSASVPAFAVSPVWIKNGSYVMTHIIWLVLYDSNMNILTFTITLYSTFSGIFFSSKSIEVVFDPTQYPSFFIKAISKKNSSEGFQTRNPNWISDWLLNIKIQILLSCKIWWVESENECYQVLDISDSDGFEHFCHQ